MALQLGPVIGKIGGAEVTTTPVSDEHQGTSWYELASIEIADGQHLMVVNLEVLSSSTGTNVRLRGVEYQMQSGLDRMSEGLVLEGPTTVTIDVRAGTSVRTVEVTGTVYTVPLPD